MSDLQKDIQRRFESYQKYDVMIPFFGFNPEDLRIRFFIHSLYKNYVAVRDHMEDMKSSSTKGDFKVGTTSRTAKTPSPSSSLNEREKEVIGVMIVYLFKYTVPELDQQIGLLGLYGGNPDIPDANVATNVIGLKTTIFEQKILLEWLIFFKALNENLQENEKDAKIDIIKNCIKDIGKIDDQYLKDFFEILIIFFIKNVDGSKKYKIYTDFNKIKFINTYDTGTTIGFLFQLKKIIDHNILNNKIKNQKELKSLLSLFSSSIGSMAGGASGTRLTEEEYKNLRSGDNINYHSFDENGNEVIRPCKIISKEQNDKGDKRLTLQDQASNLTIYVSRFEVSLPTQSINVFNHKPKNTPTVPSDNVELQEVQSHSQSVLTGDTTSQQNTHKIVSKSDFISGADKLLSTIDQSDQEIKNMVDILKTLASEIKDFNLAIDSSEHKGGEHKGSEHTGGAVNMSSIEFIVVNYFAKMIINTNSKMIAIFWNANANFTVAIIDTDKVDKHNRYPMLSKYNAFDYQLEEAALYRLYLQNLNRTKTEPSKTVEDRLKELFPVPETTNIYYRKSGHPDKLFTKIDVNGTTQEIEVQEGSQVYFDLRNKKCLGIKDDKEEESDPTATCKDLLATCLIDGTDSNIENCKAFMQSEKFWPDVQKQLISDILPDVVVELLKKFGFKAYEAFNSDINQTIYYVEDVGQWLDRLEKERSANKISDTEIKTIRENSRLKAYLDALVVKINTSPSILNPEYVGPEKLVNKPFDSQNKKDENNVPYATSANTYWNRGNVRTVFEMQNVASVELNQRRILYGNMPVFPIPFPAFGAYRMFGGAPLTMSFPVFFNRRNTSPVQKRTLLHEQFANTYDNIKKNLETKGKQIQKQDDDIVISLIQSIKDSEVKYFNIVDSLDQYYEILKVGQPDNTTFLSLPHVREFNERGKMYLKKTEKRTNSFMSIISTLSQIADQNEKILKNQQTNIQSSTQQTTTQQNNPLHSLDEKIKR